MTGPALVWFRNDLRLADNPALRDALAAGGPVLPVYILDDADAWRLRNLATIAVLVARAALRRRESRGGHFRADFPVPDDVHFKVHLVEKLD